jgi:hypothetical protein
MNDYPFWPYPMNPTRPRNKHERKFWEVHGTHPEIYEVVDRQAKRLITGGRGHYGIKEFFESFRWNTMLSMDPPVPFKIGNNYPAYYARYWLQNNPEHWGFFELRRVYGEYDPDAEPEFDANGQGIFL